MLTNLIQAAFAERSAGKVGPYNLDSTATQLLMRRGPDFTQLALPANQNKHYAIINSKIWKEVSFAKNN